MTTKRPTLVFIPGSWHRPSCYDRIIKPLREEHGIRCIAITLPSTQDNPNATFKDDIDAARSAVVSEVEAGRNLIVVAHSYGGMVGNSCIKGLTKPTDSTSSNLSGYVVGLVLIASGFTITGVYFMAPFFDIPPPQWRIDKESGYAVIQIDPREFFYHDLDPEDAEYWISQLTTQSLKSLFTGGEYAYAGWRDVPVWYVGTSEDKGLPVVVQRVQIATARSLGTVVHHTELKTSHSPFLSMPGEVVRVLVDAVEASSGSIEIERTSVVESKSLLKKEGVEVPSVRLFAPGTWFRFGLPFALGRVIGWGILGYMNVKRLWSFWIKRE